MLRHFIFTHRARCFLLSGLVVIFMFWHGQERVVEHLLRVAHFFLRIRLVRCVASLGRRAHTFFGLDIADFFGARFAIVLDEFAMHDCGFDVNGLESGHTLVPYHDRRLGGRWRRRLTRHQEKPARLDEFALAVTVVHGVEGVRVVVFVVYVRY